jgi:hypothetical protein
MCEIAFHLSFSVFHFTHCFLLVTETFRLTWVLDETFLFNLCIVGCRFPSEDIFAEKYETKKKMREEILMDPTLCFVHNLI